MNINPTKKTRIELLNEFDAAPDNALFDQKVIAAVRECSESTLERDRWAGTGIEFIKINGRIRYKKRTVLDWLDGFRQQNSTSAAT